MNKIYDLVIIGGGPAGMTAGIYAARHNLKTLLVSKSFGGQMARKTVAIENYTGFEAISGFELIDKFERHLKKQVIDVKNDEVSSLKKAGNLFYVSTKTASQFLAKAVIVATGAEPKTLGVEGEAEFIGKGVSYCVACDGPMFKNKTVVVIGGGNAGAEAAWFLSDYAAKVFILEFGPELKADAQNRKRLSAAKNIKVVFNAEVEEIKGKTFVENLVYRDMESHKAKTIKTEGVFVEVGREPATSFVGGLADLNEKKEIIVDLRNNQSKTKGLFAAGDATNNPYKQIIISAGEGAKAALAASDFLKKE